MGGIVILTKERLERAMPQVARCRRMLDGTENRRWHRAHSWAVMAWKKKKEKRKSGLKVERLVSKWDGRRRRGHTLFTGV